MKGGKDHMTIYDIAKEAGVSITTVSRVINQKPGIKESTRIKVQEVLDKYHYLPSPSAKGLAAKKSGTIALLTEDVRDAHYSHTVFMVEQELSKNGYNCLLMNTGTDKEQRIACIERAMQNQTEGVILIGSTFEEKYIQKAITRYLPNTPVVLANAYLDLPNVCGVLCDGRKGMEDAVHYLAGKGIRHIAYMGDNENASARAKKQGYLDGMEKCGLAEYTLIRKAERAMQAGCQETKKLLEQYPETEAILYEEDLIAIGGINEMTRQGIAIPDTISVIGFDNSVYTEMTIPRMSSIDDKLDAMGVKCAQTMLDMLEGTVLVSQMMLIPELVIRGSCI